MPGLSDYSQYSWVIALLLIIAWWKIFKKAGRSGILSLIPIVNTWTLFSIAGLSGVTSLFGYLGAFCLSYATIAFSEMMSILGSVLMLIFLVQAVRVSFNLARKFGHGLGFGFGLLFLAPIFSLIIAFSDDAYLPHA
jgi:hypothetical protein